MVQIHHLFKECEKQELFINVNRESNNCFEIWKINTEFIST